MKKILLFSLLLILIPYIVVSIFICDKEEKFIFTSNTMVRIKRSDSGNIDVVPLEDYVIHVIAGEMPVDFHIEALKAQAVASRSYVMYQITKSQNKDYDVIDTVLNQVYLDDNYLKNVWGNNYDEYMSKIKDAVFSTSYEYITYNGELAEALFFSTSSGITENSEDVFIQEVPYLRSVESPYDSISPAFNYNLEYTYSEFCNLLGLNYSNNINVETLDKTRTGRINKIKINEKIFSGSDVAYLLNLKSTNFLISQYDNKVHIKTSGYGHGVGMSQYGAEGMAEAGFTYDEILKHYYSGVEIEKIKF